MTTTTETTQRTPGTWMIEAAPEGIDLYAQIVYSLRTMSTVAKVYGDGDEYKEQAMANARLVAAAPDLLAALELLLELRMNGLEPDEENWPAIEDAVKRARGED